MELEIQKYLRNGGNHKDLETNFGIYAKHHEMFPQIWQYTYDMIEAKFSELIVQQCRGVIIDHDQDYKVLAYPYNKFWEEDNPLADKLDWNTTRVLAKNDGTLITLWFNPYSDSWEVATRGTPDAHGPVGMSSKTFKELFWETWNKLGYKLPDSKHICYMFELCTLENKVVCLYKESRIIFHGARDTRPEFGYNEYGGSWLIGWSMLFNWELVKLYDMNNITDVLSACESLDPMYEEGYVCVDANFNRIKCKSVQYKALSHIKDGFGKKRLIELVRSESQDTFTKFFPEYLDMYNETKAKYDHLIDVLEQRYENIKNIEVQKDFAIEAQKYNMLFTGALFQMRAGKVQSIREYFKNININSLVEYFK